MLLQISHAPTFLFNNSLTFYKCCNLKSLLIYLNHLVIHPNCLWSHNSERGSDHFWRNGFLRLRNLRTDQFFRSLLSSSKFMNSTAIHCFRTPSLNGLFKDTSSGWRRKRSPYLSRELQMSRKQASSFSSPGHRSAHFYFLCCLFNVCKLGRAWQTIESVNNTHRDFDAYFYRKKVCIIHG